MAAISTGWAGNDRYNFGTTYRTVSKYSNKERRLFIETAGSGYGARRLSATLKALIGNAAGASKVATETRRVAVNELGTLGPSSGGYVKMEQYVIQSGVTTAADIAKYQTICNPTFMPAFPLNRDGIALGIGTTGRTSSI